MDLIVMTYIHFMAVGGVGPVLELTLVVRCVANAKACQRSGKVSFGRAIVQTETPSTTDKRGQYDREQALNDT